MHRLAALGVLLAVVGCDEEPLQIDRFPIGIHLDGGVPTLLAQVGDGGLTPVVIDTGSPLTLIANPSISRENAALTLYGFTAAGVAVPRARFDAVTLLELPLAGVGPDVGGVPALPLGGVVGGDVLRQVAVRFDAARQRIFLLPAVPGSDESFAQACAALLHGGAHGGGSFALDNGVVDFPATRVVLGACVDQRALGPYERPRGDALFVLATGIYPSVMSRSAFARVTGRAACPGPLRPYWFPGGAAPVSVCEERLARLTLADDAADDRGPCDEAFANRLMAAGGCPGPLERPDVKCPCADGTTRCTAGATLALESATAEGLPVLVVADDEPLLQALRDELRPGIADVDGLLGASLLGALVVDVDYPRARVILRCADPPPPGVSCRTSPHLAFQDEELDHPACLPDAAPLPPPP